MLTRRETLTTEHHMFDGTCEEHMEELQALKDHFASNVKTYSGWPYSIDIEYTFTRVIEVTVVYRR